MSVYTNQTNANTTTSFFGSGGGGGSNFPDGIVVGSNGLNNVGYFSQTSLASTDITGNNIAPFVAFPLISGYASGGYTRVNNQSIGFQQPNTGTSAKFVDFDGTTNIALANISSVNGTIYPPSGGSSSVQAGQVTISGTSDTITLATPFSDTNYSVVCNPINNAPTFSWSAVVVTNRTFTIEANTTGLTFNWIATAWTQ
jgi:hypothetical protein